MLLRGIPLFIITYYQLCIYSAQRLVLKTSPSSPVYAAVNTDLVLTCSVDDIYLVTLRWASYTNDINSTTSNRSLTTNVIFQRLNYSDKGVYYCQAFNQSSGLMVAQTKVTLKVGDPPSRPPTPTMKRVCGYPPTEVIMSYQYTSLSLTPTQYPVTIDLLVCPMSTSNPCLRLCDNFKVVEKSRQIIDRPKNSSFEVNVADVVKEMVPDFPYCTEVSFFDCTLLCTCVRTANVFGVRYSTTRLKKIKEYSGEVANLRAIKIGRNSITLAWGLPRCLRNSTQTYHKLYYWIWCQRSSCGNKILIESEINVISGLNYTINSLLEYTNYTIYASSSFFSDFADAGEHVSISVQTKEGVPRLAPVIERLGWLSKCSGSALVSWKVNDKAALLGEVRQYVITYRVANTSSRNITNVSADAHQLKISGLRRNKSYEFTIRVCTGGGCSKASSKYSLSSYDCTSSDAPPDRFKGWSKWIWISTGVGFVFIVLAIIALFIAVFKQRHSGRIDMHRHDLPTDGIHPHASIVFPSYPPEADSDYACADGLQRSLSRSSSVLTCSTQM